MGAQADQVRDDILSRVLGRKLLPGDRIDESDLRSRLRLSITPVREAIIALETAGVVERRPRDGARITSLDLEGMMKLVEVLAELEGAVAGLAARRINASQAVVMRRAARACTEFAEGRGDPGADYFDLNVDFHRSLIAAAGNEQMERSVFNVANRLVAYLSARHSLPGEPQRSARDHEAIAAAVLDTKPDLARNLMIEHVTLTDRNAIDVMNVMRS